MSFLADWGATLIFGAFVAGLVALLGPLVGAMVSGGCVFGGWLIARAIDRGFGGRPS